MIISKDEIHVDYAGPSDASDYWVVVPYDTQEEADLSLKQILANQTAIDDLTYFRKSDEFAQYSEADPKWALGQMIKIIDKHNREAPL